MSESLAAEYLAALGKTAGVETPGGPAALDLSRPAIDGRLERMREELMAIVEGDHGGAPAMRGLVDRLVASGREALSRLASDGPAADVDHGSLRASLEVIVREDGSRPAFQIVNGRPRPGAHPDD